MRSKAIFYQAGCPVCVDAEKSIVNALDRSRYDVEIVHLGEARGRIAEAQSHGVKSVPALILESQVYHINFGANRSDLTN